MKNNKCCQESHSSWPMSFSLMSQPPSVGLNYYKLAPELYLLFLEWVLNTLALTNRALAQPRV
jgi:hypothetical protein